MYLLQTNFRRELGESNLRFESLERNARRYKETFPPMPKCPQHIIEAFSDTKIFDKFAFNLRRTHQFYIGTVEYDAKHFFSVFASHQIMDMIEKNIPQNERNYLIDGTLKVTPIGGFYQLMVIHIEYKNDVSVFQFNSIDFWLIYIFSHFSYRLNNSYSVNKL